MSANIQLGPVSKTELEHQILNQIYSYAESRPEHDAIRFLDESLSYAELVQKLKQFQRGLQQRGVSKGSTVGVSVNRSINLVPLLLATWSLGAAYVPIDPSYPLERKNYIISDAAVKLLVEGNGSTTLDYDGPSAFISDLLEQVDGLPDQNLSETAYDADDLAYIIYTSGSTGAPKGVAVNQKNVANFIQSMASKPGLSASDTLLAVTTISFDIHVLELFLPLYQGATLVVASDSEIKSPLQLQTLVELHSVSCMQATPATWRVLLGEGWKPELPFKALIGGEALPKDLLPALLNSSSALWNMYGPTETTVWSTCFNVESESLPVYIGKPVRNTQLYVVDENLNPVSDGVSGELLIGGDGVTAGYHGKPDLTREKFIQLAHLSDGLVYRTGDLVIRHGSGNVEYINRIDNQIKLRGFRMEPGDIECSVEKHAQVKQSCVVLGELEPGDERLLCFYLGDELSPQELIAHCSKHLPPHMVPQHFIQLVEFPKTENLKVDRKALRKNAASYINKTLSSCGDEAESNLERCIIGIWERVLGVTGLTVEDNFFFLGGHSLLALAAVNKMNSATGKHFSSDAIFTHPTIESLIKGNELDGINEEHAIVAKLNNNQTGVPIYCLCGMQIYNEFALAIEPHNPVYAVFGKQEIALLNHDNDENYFDTDKFVCTYVDAIQRKHKKGPLILAGFSFGGVLSLEISKRLRSLGFDINSVVLIDSYTPKGFRRSARKTAIDIYRSCRAKGIVNAANSGFARLKSKITGQNDLHTVVTQKEREEVFDLAAKAFAPRITSYDGDIILFKAKKNNFGFGMAGLHDYGWGDVINGKIEMRSYDLDHTGIMEGHGVIELVRDLRDYISEPDSGER